MTSLALASAAALLGVCLAAAPAPAQALLSRTFVSAASGNDANNCDRLTPCRTFQAAHDKTNPDGEIMVLDPGGYGAVTITKSISIVNDGVGEASILVSSGATGITVSGGAAAYVNLRGLTVQGIGFGGGTGLRFSSGFALTITKCVFRKHTSSGIFFTPQVGGTSSLSIFDTLLADNGAEGIEVLPQAQGVNVRLVLERAAMMNNSHDGVFLDGNQASGAISAIVKDSVSANNGGNGFSVFSINQTAMSVVLAHAVIANNGGTGVFADGPMGVRIGKSTITANGTTWIVANGANLQSFGDNYIVGNRDGDPAPPRIASR
jgi:hypothetical protein